MAGSYPDVPGLRMAWDRDGSIAFDTSGAGSGTVAVWSTTDCQYVNDETFASYKSIASPFGSWGVIFPELRDIQGYCFSTNELVNLTVHTSVDTTNGVDGTWVSRGSAVAARALTIQELRTNIATVSWLGIKCVRFTGDIGGSRSVQATHLFGSPAAGQNPNRLRFWHPTLDQEVSGPYFDLGDVSRGSTNTTQFRIKNNSGSLTATSIAITREALTDTTPTNVGQVEFSTDNVTYASSISIGNLAPGAISPILYTRRTTLPTATLALWWVRFVATASSWA